MITITPLENLLAWVKQMDTTIAENKFLPISQIEVTNLRKLILIVANGVHYSHPQCEAQLRRIEQNLFNSPDMYGYRINLCVFGQLFLIVHYISEQPKDYFWSNIHPRVVSVAQAEYVDGYFDSAAEKALREVETYLRELYSQAYPDLGEPKEISTIKDKLLNDENVYMFDRQTQSGKNFFDGIKSLFDNVFKAYRNPTVHRNIKINKREASERIMLASQLLYVLDERKK